MSWPSLLVTFGSLFALAACGTTPDTKPTGLGQETELAPGQSAQVGALRLTFAGIAGDSRCPVDVVCVWEGDAVARLELREPPRNQETRELHTTGAREATYGSFRVELVRVTPAPRSTEPIPPESYRVTIRVTASS